MVSISGGADDSATAATGLNNSIPNQMTHSSAHTRPGMVSPSSTAGSKKRRATSLRPIAIPTATATTNAQANPSATRSTVMPSSSTNDPSATISTSSSTIAGTPGTSTL